MLSAINSALMANNPYEQLLQQIVRIESQPRADYQAKLRTAERQSDILGDLDSSVSALHSLIQGFTDTISSSLDGRSASQSDDTNYGVTASGTAATGSHTLQVERLASTDTRITQQYSASGTSLRAFFDSNGSQTFSIGVAHPTEADPDNRVDVSVTVNPTGDDDEAILQEIATAINDAMNAAEDAGTIDSDERSSASKVNETSDTARLSLRSGQSGFANRMTFTDSANGLLAALDITNTAVASGTAGGQVTMVGTSETDSLLNSKMIVDGLTLYRSGNQVDDALSGVTLNLKQVMTGAESFTVGPDTEGMKSQVTDFITKYNEIVTQLTGATQVDGDLQIRGIFAGDSTLRSLRFNLRNDIAAQVSGQPTGAPLSITELGIEIAEDGSLSLADEDAFTDAVEADPAAFKTLFTGADGIATRLETRLDGYLGADGILDNRVDILDESIKRITDQIADFDDKMQRRENQLRQQYAKIQESISLFQGQQQFIGGFLGGGGFF